MSALPDPATPLYHHPLPALERWLQASVDDPSPGYLAGS